ncbi:MAG TPA: hypothetical protein VK846_06885, partial [Candidatus Limnocylindria bacterium]|nr:hypothetical protein [Candidatus Limnocylindria bacterium]
SNAPVSGGTVTGTASATHWSTRVFRLNDANRALVAGAVWQLAVGADLGADEPQPDELMLYAYTVGANREVTRAESLDVRIIDDDARGVLVVETNGGTQLVEPSEEVFVGSGFLTQATSARLDLTQVTTAASWRVQLRVGSETFNYSTSSGGSSTSMAAGLQSAINGQNGFSATNPGDGILRVERGDGQSFTVVFYSDDPNGEIKLVGDFGTAVTREVGVHDSVFIAQDLDAAKWNSNSNPDIADAIGTPHLTVLGAGDGRSDFYSFEITEGMIESALSAYTLAHAGSSVGFPGVQALFDIDHGFEQGDSVVWVSTLRLYELRKPLDPEQPTLPALIAEGLGWSPVPWDPGTNFYYDDNLEYFFAEKGTYYIEVTARYPTSDGLPEGVDYQLHVSVAEHAQDTFLFAPQPVAEDENGNNSAQDIDAAGNFFTFYDPTVGNTDFGGGIDFGIPYVRVQGAGNGSFDIYQFEITSDMLATPVPSPDPEGGDSITNSDTSQFYEYVKYQLSGNLKTGDVWTLGLRYKNYSVAVGNSYTIDGVLTAVTTLEQLAKALKGQILADPRYTLVDPATSQPFTTIIVNTAGGVFLEIMDEARGFNLEGETPSSSNVPQPFLTNNVSGFVGTVTRTTTAYQQNGSTPITFANAAVEIEGTINTGDIWTVVLGSAPSDVYTYTVGSLTGLNAAQRRASVADGLQAAINPGGGTAGDAFVTLTDTAFTVAVSITAPKPESFATINGTPAGQTVAGGLATQVKNIRWTTLTVSLTGSVYENQDWSLTVDGETHTATAGRLSTTASLADDLRDDFDVSGSGNLIVFNSLSDATVDFGITRPVAEGSAVITTPSARMLTIEAADLTATDDWTITLPGVASGIEITIPSSPTRTGVASALAAAINNSSQAGNADYEAFADGSRIVVFRNGGTAGLSILIEQSDGTDVTTLAGAAISAARLNLNGDPDELETWSITGLGQTVEYLVAEDENAAAGDIAANLRSDITGPYFALGSGDIIYIYRADATSFTPALQISTPVISGSATVSGAPELNWQMIITPDLANYPFHLDDTWNITVGANTLYYTAGQFGESAVPNGLRQRIANANIAGLNAGVVGNTIVLTRTDGSLIAVGDLEVIRVQDDSDASKTSFVGSHFLTVQYTLNDGADSAAMFTQDWVPGEKWILTIDGVESSYTVRNSDTTDNSQRNLKLIAEKLVLDINSKHPDLLVRVVVGSQFKVRIELQDRDNVPPPSDGDSRKDPVTFTVHRGGTVRAVFDIDNARVIQTPFYTISPSIELVRVSDGSVLARDWFGLNPALNGNLVTKPFGSLDKGSFTEYDPFIEYSFGVGDSDQKFMIRVSSVVTYTSFFFNQQFDLFGVYPGLSYDLVMSLPRHERNDNAIDLV